MATERCRQEKPCAVRVYGFSSNGNSWRRENAVSKNKIRAFVSVTEAVCNLEWA